MKANNAPEKIYVHRTIHLGLLEASEMNITGSDIEYTRTDAFIEKACNAYCAVCDTKECQGCAECSWVIKFRKQFMKLL